MESIITPQADHRMMAFLAAIEDHYLRIARRLHAQADEEGCAPILAALVFHQKNGLTIKTTVTLPP